MHKLLQRQLKRRYGSLDAVPPAVLELVQDIDDAYRAHDEDRALTERSLELTSQELMQRNAELRESEERYRRIVDTATEGIWILGPENAIFFVNERMAEMLGYPLHEMAGRSIYDFMPADQRAENEKRLRQRRPGVKEHHDIKFRRQDGSEMWAIVSTSPIYEFDGTYRGSLGMITDITGRKRAEESLRTAFERLKELDQFRSQFINNAAHELGTPLTPIKLQVHLLRNAYWDSLHPELQKATEILDRNVERLSNLVSDIVDVARIQSGRLNLKPVEVPIAPLVMDATESFQSSAVAKGIGLETTAEPALVCHVDERRLSQVLFNLLTNAIKFTRMGGHISVAARRVGVNAQISVHDTGIGIRPEDVPRLFQPFNQVHDTMQFSAPGTGLGLFVSRGLVEQMGGRIWCESAGAGKGCNFIVELPIVTDVVSATSRPLSAPAAT